MLSHTKSNGHEHCDTDAPPFHKATMDLGRSRRVGADDALAPQTTHAVLAVHDGRSESTMEAVRHVVLTKNYAELIDEACKSDEPARVAEKHRRH